MSAQEDQPPTDGQPTQSQSESGSAAETSKPPTSQDEAIRSSASQAPGDDEADPARRGSSTRRGRRRGVDGRYVRSYRSFDASLHDFRDELSAIADDVRYLLRNESVVNPELKSELEQRFNRLRGTVSMLAEDAVAASDRLRVGVEDDVQARIAATRDAVQQRPITSVAMAAVIGMSIGMLLSRRR